MNFYLDPHQKLMWSILAREPSYIQVSWRSVKYFLCNPADKQPTNMGETTTALVEVTGDIRRDNKFPQNIDLKTELVKQHQPSCRELGEKETLQKKA